MYSRRVHRDLWIQRKCVGPAHATLGNKRAKQASKECLKVRHIGAGMGGTTTGKNNTCEQRDSCLTLSLTKTTSPQWLRTSNVRTVSFQKAGPSVYLGISTGIFTMGGAYVSGRPPATCQIQVVLTVSPALPSVAVFILGGCCFLGGGALHLRLRPGPHVVLGLMSRWSGLALSEGPWAVSRRVPWVVQPPCARRVRGQACAWLCVTLYGSVCLCGSVCG